MATNVDSDMLRLRRSPAKSQRKVERKDQLLKRRNLHNWVVCLKILIRENLFYVKKEDRDQTTHAKTVAFREVNQRIHELERNTEDRFSDQQRNLVSQWSAEARQVIDEQRQKFGPGGDSRNCKAR